ncbi:MAG: NTP transferase domain-containing protein, partial [Gammaproteobacteria bacterium]|nr:NTP transferase domain-containing protein [Gammaproteobacteria bacterium]
MRVMLLSAGRGERMRPLTDAIPKPLLTIGGKPLIVHLVEALVAEGFRELVINHAWHGAMIEQRLGDGQEFGANIEYSAEGANALETGGGIRR